MTKEAIMKLQTYKLFEDGELLVCRDDVLKALEQEPCEDTISRQAAIDALRDEKCPLKLVETTRNISGRNPIDKFVCEKCGFMIDGWTAFNFEDETDDRFDYEFAFKFCPDCGRKVEK